MISCAVSDISPTRRNTRRVNSQPIISTVGQRVMFRVGKDVDDDLYWRHMTNSLDYTFATIRNLPGAYPTRVHYTPHFRAGRNQSFNLPPEVGITANATTFNVANQHLVFTQNTLATTITNLPGGVVGQELTIMVRDANTTIANRSGGAGEFGLWQDANLSAQINGVYQFVWHNNGWVQIGGYVGP